MEGSTISKECYQGLCCVLGVVLLLSCGNNQENGAQNQVKKAKADKSVASSRPPAPEPIIPNRNNAVKPNGQKNSSMQGLLTSANNARSFPQLQELIAKATGAGFTDDTTFAENFATILAKQFPVEVILQCVESWPEGLSKATFAQSLVEGVAVEKGFTEAIILLPSFPATTSARPISEGGAIIRKTAFEVLGKWGASHALKETISWIESLPDTLEGERSSAILGTYDTLRNQVATGDRAGLDIALRAVNSSELANRLYELGYKYVAHEDATKARQWALGIEMDTPLFVDGKVIQNSEPEIAIAHINDLLDLGYNVRATGAVTAYTAVLAGQSPQSALNWIAQFPPEVDRNEAIANAAAVWRGSDINAARQWAQSFADRTVAEEAMKWLK
jgi:hypothetical protein